MHNNRHNMPLMGIMQCIYLWFVCFSNPGRCQSAGTCLWHQAMTSQTPWTKTRWVHSPLYGPQEILTSTEKWFFLKALWSRTALLWCSLIVDFDSDRVQGSKLRAASSKFAAWNPYLLPGKKISSKNLLPVNFAQCNVFDNYADISKFRLLILTSRVWKLQSI